MELDTTPNMEVGAREPGNDDKEKMTLAVPICSDPIIPPTRQHMFRPTVLYSYLAGKKGGKKTNDSVATS